MANSISGRALAGTVLALTGTATASVTAGPTGLYSFTGLAAGPYTITPTKPGIVFTPTSSLQTIVATDITGVNFLGQSVGSQGSTYTIQDLIDRIVSLPDMEPILNVAGSASEPALTAANDVINEICGTSFPHKWNRGDLPVFYTWSWQQDYALVNPDFSSVYAFEWMERGMAINISSTQIPKPWVRVEAGRDLPQRTGTFAVNGGTELGDPGYIVSSLPNSELYYGTWGATSTNNKSWGNDPQPGSFYLGPLGIFVEGATWSSGSGGRATFTLNQLPNGLHAGQTITITEVVPTGYNGTWTVVSVPGSAVADPQVVVTMTSNPGTYQSGGIFPGSGGEQPANPISQIVDANGNLLLITTYGNEGTTAPLASVNAVPGTQVSGTGATTIWTVVDPVGMGMRILNVPSQTGVVWQFNMVGQFVPPKYTSLQNTLAPFPDKYEPYFRSGMIANLFQYSTKSSVANKFEKEWAKWQKSLNDLRAAEDRELEEWSFIPERTVMGQGRSRNTFRGAAWPFPYPIVN
jgi:hypothetical protein